MADFRNIHTRIWTDSWFCELSPDEKLLFIYLFSNPNASVCGMYEMPKRNIALDTGISLDRVSQILDTFSASGKVHYQNGVVWVVNLKKYNDSGDSSKIRVRIAKDLAALPDCEMKRQYFQRENIPYPETNIGYPEKMSETERRQKGEETETGEDAPSPASPDFRALSENTVAERVYLGVTSMAALPSSMVEKSYQLWRFAMDRGGIEQAVEYLKPFYNDWVTRKNKSGALYSRTGSGWVDWAIAGETPQKSTDQRRQTRGRGVPEV